jgi:site-specific recombinase XerD
METALIETKPDLVHLVALRIAKEQPKLEALSSEEIEQLARVVVAETLRDELKAKVNREKIDYPVERARFLAKAASPHTQRAYVQALDRLESWCERQGIAPVELAPATADDWIESEKASGAAPGSVRLHVAGVSAFFTWMERRHADIIRNPFRGSRARPKNKSARTLAVPSEKEIKILKNTADSMLRAAIAVMAGLGLRVGGLPSLAIHRNRFTTTTKGKDQAGTVPEDVRKEIERAGLPLRSPFANQTAGGIADRFRYLTKRLHEAGEIAARYSVHDLRHAFAVRRYQDGRDIYAVSKALGHAGVSVTERYLRSLGLEG